MWIFALIFLFLSLFSFNQSIVNQSQISSANIPVNYYLKELQESLNRNFQIDKKGIICEDLSYTNNDNDNFKVICHQLSDIKISSTNNKVITEVEVRINAEYLINYEVKIDFWLFQFEHVFTFEPPIEFDIYVTFTTDVTIDENLNTVVSTSWDYKWLNLPYIAFGPISFRVFKEIDPKVDKVIQRYAQDEIDKTILKEVNIKKILRKVWGEFKKPLLINKEYNLWNFFKLQKIKSGGLKINTDKITFPFHIKFWNYTGFGSNIIDENYDLWENHVPENFFFTNIDFTNKKFFLRVPIKLAFSDIERIIFKEISRKDFIFKAGNLQMKITEVYLSVKKNLIVAEVYLRSISENSFLGSLVLRITFNPFYNIYTKKLQFGFFNYEIIRSGTVLVDIVNAMQKQDFAQILEEVIILEFDSYIKEILVTINENIANYEYNENIIFNAFVKNIDIRNITVQKSEVYIIANFQGGLEINLKNLF